MFPLKVRRGPFTVSFSAKNIVHMLALLAVTRIISDLDIVVVVLSSTPVGSYSVRATDQLQTVMGLHSRHN